MDEGVVDILIYLLLTSPAEQSTRWVGGGGELANSSVWCGLYLAMYSVIIMFAHVGGVDGAFAATLAWVQLTLIMT